MFKLNKTNVQLSIQYHYEYCNNNYNECNKLLQANKINGFAVNYLFSMYSVGVH